MEASSTQQNVTPANVPQMYARKATGLVRQVPLFDMILFNAASTTPIGASLAFGLFFALSLYPRCNILLAIAISLGLGMFVWVTFAVMAATIPKVGGDYVYVGRVLHPALGLGSNLCVFLGSAFAAGAYASWMTTIALVPAFQIIGTVTGSKGWLDAATTISSRGWIFAIGAASVLVLSILSVFGTKLVVRAMTVLFGIAFIGLAISFVLLAVTSRHTFIHDFNRLASPLTHQRDAYHDTIASAAKTGLTYPGGHGYSVRSTFGAIFVGFGLVLFTWWSAYMAAEMKGAGRRRRQLTSMVGAGLGQGILLLVAGAVFLGTVGYNFFAAANSPAYKVPVSPYYNFFASIVGGSSFMSVILALLFVAWFLPGLYINLAMMHRAPFAWAFDGLIPRRVAQVSDRTHTPVVSIAVATVLAIGAAAWAAYSKSFVTVLAASTLMSLMPIVFTGLSALVGSRRRPEIFADSAATWRVGGLPVLPIAGAGCALVGLFGIGLALDFHTEIGFSLAAAIALPVGSMLLAAAYYFALRAWRRRRGVDLDLLYKTIPPD